MRTNKNTPHKPPVPTLDGVGWVKHGIHDKLDWLLALFFTTDAGQSSLYEGTLRTFQSIRADNINNVRTLASDLEDYVKMYLSRYFRSVTVTIEYTDQEGTKRDLNEIQTARIGLYMTVEVEDEGESTKLNKPVIYQKGVFQYTLDKFNGK